ncbi:MAG: DinB family protein [Schleiferiaceae bacterium]|jgi:hypothetical protein|nr:DinB family protein [Schleiferiaceae bacterium]
MNFSIERTLEILRQTPQTLRSMLGSLSDDWLHSNEGPETWSPYNVIGHLIVGEQTDWMVRAKIILRKEGMRKFEPFDRFAQFKMNQEQPIQFLLNQFETLRNENIAELNALDIQKNDLIKTGIHPEFGEVTLQQLLSTWAVHDLGHIIQISRVMAKQYATEAGPWQAYLKVLQ